MKMNYAVQIKEERGNMHNSIQFENKTEGKRFEAYAKDKVFKNSFAASLAAASMCSEYKYSISRAYSKMNPGEPNPYECV